MGETDKKYRIKIKKCSDETYSWRLYDHHGAFPFLIAVSHGYSNKFAANKFAQRVIATRKLEVQS